MPETQDRIEVHVPDGYPPQTLPVKVEDRIDASDILILPVTQDDMVHLATGLHANFPSSWYAVHEPLSRRPPPHERALLFAQRYRIWPTYPHFHLIKAQHAKTGEVMGYAGWHAPEHMVDGGVWTGMFRRVTVRALMQKENMEMSEEEEEERLWANVDVERWEREFDGYDGVRREEMGEGTPHWFLAPFFVHPAYRSRGIGSALMRYALDRADAHDPPLPCYLESFPNARPVYYRYGFEDVDTGKGPGREMVMIRPATQKQKKREGKDG